MSDINPYSSPLSNPYADHEELDTSVSFDESEFRQIKKLYYRSCNVNAITFLFGLGFIFLATSWQEVSNNFNNLQIPLIVPLVFNAVVVVGLFLRTTWGRHFGIFVSFLALPFIPFGTVVGIFGLFAFIGSPRLFGPHRITHRKLKAQFTSLKADWKMRNQ